MAEKDVFARKEEFERSTSGSGTGSAHIRVVVEIWNSTITCSCSVWRFLPFHSYHCNSCPPGFGHPHHDGRPGVLPRQRKEEVGAAPARARQHHPCYLRGPRAAGLQHHHQANLTHPFLTLDLCSGGGQRWHPEVHRSTEHTQTSGTVWFS